MSACISLPQVAGAIIGRALFNKNVDLEAALALAAEPTGMTPEFI